MSKFPGDTNGTLVVIVLLDSVEGVLLPERVLVGPEDNAVPLLGLVFSGPLDGREVERLVMPLKEDVACVDREEGPGVDPEVTTEPVLLVLAPVVAGIEVDCTDSVDKLSGVDTLVWPGELDSDWLAAVDEPIWLDTGCPDELTGWLVEPARLEVIPVLEPPIDCEVDIEPPDPERL